MKFSITGKLILIIGLLSLITLTAMFMLTRMKFQSDLLEYVNQQTEERLAGIAELAVPYYRINQTWDPLRRQPRLWRQMLAASDLAFRQNDESLNAAGNQNSDNRNTNIRTSTAIARSTITLLDSDRQFVAGDDRTLSRTDIYIEPISMNGEIIGYVMAPVRTQLIDRIDQQFANSQLRSGYAIGLLVLAMVLIITAIVVHRMVRPLLLLKQGTQMLTEGDYTARVELRGRDELGELANDFNQLATTLDKNRTNQRHWISNISHELRTPIAILRGELETMQAGIKPADKEGLSSLEEEVDRLTRLVDDLYLLSLSDAHEISYYKEIIDARTLIDQVVSESAARAQQSKVSIDWHAPAQPAPVNVDAQRMCQVLHNLLENCYRYAGENSSVRISLAQTKSDVVLTIEDSGEGVSDEELSHLFERLYRADQSRNRSSGGSGLGLAICQGIVEDHDGTIKAEHSAMGGLSVRILLPVAKVD